MNRRGFLKALGFGFPAAFALPKSGLLEAFARLIEKLTPWTVKPTVELAAYHTIGAEREIALYLGDKAYYDALGMIMAERMAFEIDLEILDDLVLI